MLPVPQDRLSGRRSSSIVSRTLLGRRASVYASTNQQDPAKTKSETSRKNSITSDSGAKSMETTTTDKEETSKEETSKEETLKEAAMDAETTEAEKKEKPKE